MNNTSKVIKNISIPKNHNVTIISYKYNILLWVKNTDLIPF